MLLAERETTITYDMEEKVVRIFSSVRKDQNKVEKMGFKPVYGDVEQGFGYRIPLDRFKWGVRKVALGQGRKPSGGFKKVEP